MDETHEFFITEASAVELVRNLDKAYPPRCPLPGEPLESIHRYAGARNLIEDLLTAIEVERDDASTVSG